MCVWLYFENIVRGSELVKGETILGFYITQIRKLTLLTF